MILPSSGGGALDFDAGSGRETSYFALQPSNLSSPSSDEFVGGQFFSEPTLEHDRENLCPGLFYYYWHKPCLTKKRSLIGGFVLGCVVLIVILSCTLSGIKGADALVPPDPEEAPPPSWSKLRTFGKGAVCADGAPCADIGKSILQRNGSAVDAAIAALLCNGLVNMQSMGLGGGFIMTIYDKESDKSFVLNARDAAPRAAGPYLFKGKSEFSSLVGGLAITVPGELAGYWEAHQRFGKLPWSELFEPTIKLCEQGYNLTKIQHEAFTFNKTNFFLDKTFVEMFVDPKTKTFYKPGTIIKPKKLCETFQIIAKNTAAEFYNGTLGRTLVDDIQKRGSIITFKDLNDYRAKWQEPVHIKLNDGTRVYSPGLPGSGGLLALILNVFDEFNFTPKDFADLNSTVITYHRMLETFKYTYALRTQLGDVELPELFKNLTSKDFARSIRNAIYDNRTFNDPVHYGAKRSEKTSKYGTAHVSVISERGDAVSVTSSINTYFGSGIISERTGVMMSSSMDDFGVPGKLSFFGIPANENNFIGPGKRPLSSMSPAILVDSNGEVKMTIGAAGGTKITTSIAYVIARHLWLGNSLKEAVDAPRIHHQLYPMSVSYEYGVTRPIIDGLKAIGHKTVRYRDRGSVICALVKKNNTIYANADYRKGGDVYGH